MAILHEAVLDQVLEVQNSHQLSIIKLSEPISGALKHNAGERTSDVSAEVFENPTPASLEADLAHYKVFHTPAAKTTTDSCQGTLF
jgi:hypothetical protein